MRNATCLEKETFHLKGSRMSFVGGILKTVLLGFMQSPFKTLGEIGRRFIPGDRGGPQVSRLRQIVQELPLILQIETINVCNAACLFCAYSSMRRNKGVMSLALFEKIVKDYTEMGGGPVSLTPIVGDALLDPHLMERLRMLEAYPAINQVTITTNGIALDRYSDEDIRRLLSTLYCLQVSIGGLDAATYELMYGVDRFSQVRQAMERLVRLRDTVQRPAHITFAFRTNDWKFEARFKKLIREYRERGVFISHISTYANYAGVVRNDEKRNLMIARNKGKKRITCVTPSMCMGICWEGTITACSCADFDGDKLTIGHAERDHLAEVWAGEKRTGILDSFGKGEIRPICRECSAYTPDTIFAGACFKGIEPHQPLPLDFFRQMMT
jgi:MoaA/NifB/PqqE/SkfB family radical SAM enzyme